MNKADLNNVRASAARASSLEEVDVLLARVESALQQGEIRYSDSGAAMLSIYTAARRLSESDPQAGWRFLFDGLLPLYLRPSNARDIEKRHAFSRCRELAEEWLNEYRGDDAETLIERAMRYVASHLDPKNKSAFERACWAAQSIGYRDIHLSARLHALLQELPGSQGDEVLRAITDLGVPAAEQSFLRQELHHRVRRRLNPALFHALRELADESTFELLFGAKPPHSVTNAKPGDLDWLMSVLARIAERSGPGALSDQVVRTIERFYRKNPQAVSTSVYLGGYLLPHCDSPETSRFIAALVAEEDETEERTTHALWLLDHRLQACVRPAQLAGMDEALGPQALAALQARALTPGTYTGRSTTLPGEAKRCAVNTALTFGAVDTLSWFEPILKAEKNPFVLHELMETYSAFRFDPLPTAIRDWITEVKNAGDDDADAKWMLSTAASDLAKSSGGEAAFEVLLHPGFTLRGSVMHSTVDGLAKVALCLAQASADGARSVVAHLTDTLASEPIAPQASAVCHALAVLASATQLPASTLGMIWHHARDEKLKEYPRSQLASAMGFFAEVSRSPDILGWLRQVAADDDGWLGWRALEALARLGALTEGPGSLTSKVGLKNHETVWSWSKDAPQFQWSTGVVARLYRHQPQSFALAVAAILRDGDFAQAAQLLPILEGPADPAVVEALVERIDLSNTPRTVEFGLFLHLGRLAPQRLMDEDWSALWTNWLPEARVDLADAIYRHWPLAGIPAENGVRQLVPLLGDGHFGVRRAAARALGRVAPNVLFALCDEAASSDRVADRVRAAELSSWMPSAHRDPAWIRQRDSLLSDRHKAVRESATEASLTDQRRLWGLAHLEKVLQLRQPDNAAMLTCWRYGRALAHTGDDEALWLLAEHLEKESPAPNVGFFQAGIAKDLEKLWNDVVRKKWPEPVTPSRGSTEAGDGAYIDPSGKSYPVSYTMWRSAATIDHAGTRWGGSAQVKDDGKFGDGLVAKEGTFQWEDGRRGKVYVTTVSNGTALIFSGSGAYPLARDGRDERTYVA